MPELPNVMGFLNKRRETKQKAYDEAADTAGPGVEPAVSRPQPEPELGSPIPSVADFLSKRYNGKAPVNPAPSSFSSSAAQPEVAPVGSTSRPATMPGVRQSVTEGFVDIPEAATGAQGPTRFTTPDYTPPNVEWPKPKTGRAIDRLSGDQGSVGKYEDLTPKTAVELSVHNDAVKGLEQSVQAAVDRQRRLKDLKANPLWLVAAIRDGRILPSEMEDVKPEQINWQALRQVGGDNKLAPIADLAASDPNGALTVLKDYMQNRETTGYDVLRSIKSAGTDIVTFGAQEMDVPPQTGAGQAAHFATQVVGQIPLVLAAEATIPAKIASPVARGAIIGGELAAAREVAGGLARPEEFELGESLKNIATNAAEYAAYMGVYSRLNPAVESLVSKSPRLAGVMESIPGQVVKDGAIGAVAGGTVGTGKAVLDALMGEGIDLKDMVRKIGAESKGELQEEVVEAIALSIAQGIGRRFGVNVPKPAGNTETPAQPQATQPPEAQPTPQAPTQTAPQTTAPVQLSPQETERAELLKASFPGISEAEAIQVAQGAAGSTDAEFDTLINSMVGQGPVVPEAPIDAPATTDSERLELVKASFPNMPDADAANVVAQGQGKADAEFDTLLNGLLKPQAQVETPAPSPAPVRAPSAPPVEATLPEGAPIMEPEAITPTTATDPTLAPTATEPPTLAPLTPEAQLDTITREEYAAQGGTYKEDGTPANPFKWRAAGAEAKQKVQLAREQAETAAQQEAWDRMSGQEQMRFVTTELDQAVQNAFMEAFPRADLTQQFWQQQLATARNDVEQSLRQSGQTGEEGLKLVGAKAAGVRTANALQKKPAFKGLSERYRTAVQKVLQEREAQGATGAPPAAGPTQSGAEAGPGAQGDQGQGALSVREQLRQKAAVELQDNPEAERHAGFDPRTLFQTAQQRKAGQQQAQSYSFADQETEKRFQEAKGVQPPSMWATLGEMWQTFKNQSTREWEYLARGAEFAELRFQLNRVKQGKAIAGDQTIRHMQGLTVKFNPAQYDLFTRKVVLDDIMEDIRNAEEKGDEPKLAFGFTPDSARRAQAEVTNLVNQDPAVKESVEQRKALVKEIVDEYMKAADEAVGYRPPLNRRDYFRHQVLAYQNLTGPKGTGQKLKAPTGRGFAKTREGSDLDYNTEYRQAEFEWMAQMLYDTRVFRLLKLVKDKHDISGRLQAEAQAEGKDWKQALPEGYVLWQPREGNMTFQAWSIPERAIQQAMAQMKVLDVEYMDIFPEDLRNVLVMGAKRPELAIPEGVAKTLDQLGKVNESSVIDQGVRKIIGAWKRWQLLSPGRVIKYNLNNLSGDSDVQPFNPGGYKRVPKAANDLYEFLIRKNAPSAELDAWLARGGLEINQQVAEGIHNLNGLEVFWNLTQKRAQTMGEKAITLPKTAWNGYWKAVRMGSDFREALLRYANFVEYREQMAANNGRPTNFGASLPEEVMALSNTDDRAFKLANDLMGAYDEVTVTGQWMRERLAPFWSFQEVNARRYYRLVKNALNDGTLTQKAGEVAARRLAGVVVKAPLTAMNIGKFVVRANLLVAALSAWNYLMRRDEEEELPKDVRSRPHIVLGRDDNGKVQYLTVSGSWYDFISWFGLNETPAATQDFLSGKKTIKEIVTEMAKAPVNKLAQAIGGPAKTVVEAGIGKSSYPDIFEMRPVRDKWEELAGSLGLREEYKLLKNKPVRGEAEDGRLERYFKGLSGRVVSASDPDEAAYNEVQNLKYEYLEKLGKGSGGGQYTPRSNAMYYFKLAVRYEDEAAAKYWLAEYARLGGTKTNLKESIEASAPLGGLSEKQKADFLRQLSPEDRERYDTAQRFYVDVIAGGNYKGMPEYRSLPTK